MWLYSFYRFNFLNFEKIKIMNILSSSTSVNQKNIIITFISRNENKCQCGKTKDSNGNCDGSHTKK